ncbi:hypothetical protein [Pseudoalteromonas ulvae]|uniref:Uncharacterized protein n=1 Tax=Pseudoalteromonas ulvae TaxID=107327 RepID=A0A244CP16_PSEDV|nr:hypothetical protein [Pseudoalteromonas ulvae]OUL57256.1 hypothetical protein B1199_13895 [Pseudoalteromonas ulvae]
MKAHISSLIQYLTNKDFSGLLTHYQRCDVHQQIDILAFVYQQSLKSLSVFEFYQHIATKLIQSNGLPELIIQQINTADALSFFTPALQCDSHFSKTNELKRNVVHYLLAGDTPPFNYLRSLLLFESNEHLAQALCQRDCKNLTPIEVYLRINKQFSPLAPHEFNALLALMEAEQTFNPANRHNLTDTLKQVAKHLQQQVLILDDQIERIGLIGAYYGLTAKQVYQAI